MKARSLDPTRDEIAAIAAQWVARRDAGFSSADRQAFECWLAADERHRAALAFYEATWSALAKPSRVGAGTELERELNALARRRRQGRFAVAGTALALVIACGVAFWKHDSRAPGAAVPVSTAVLLPRQETLPDGSIVDLNTGAEIAVEFSPSVRRVSLRRGEAHFAVAKNPLRPFVVAASGVEVRAVGTAFSVQLGAAAVEVLVTEGTVAVQKPDPATALAADSQPTPLATVNKGRRAIIDLTPSAAPATVAALPAGEMDERLAWRSPRLEFTRTTLADAIALFNQHGPPAGPRFVIGDNAIASLRISGVFRADNIEAFALLLEGAFGVKAERSDNTVTLRKAP